MTVPEILKELQELGNEKLITQNKKRGAGDNQFGVKLGDIRKLAKKIKTNQDLAVELWKTEQIEARLLSILIIKPQQLSVGQLDNMVRSADYAQLADWLNAYVVKQHPEKELLRKDWMTADHPWIARAGWNLTADRIAKNPTGLDLDALLKRIEAEMEKAAPEVQWTMNMTLAQTGIHFPEFRQRALAIGEKLGVYRDFPVSKGCTSPFAPIWINEMVRRQG